MMTPQQYMSEWHKNFVNYINELLNFIGTLIILPQATEEDKKGLAQEKLMLLGRDVQDIEQTLAAGIVKNDTLDKIEKMDKDLTDIAVEHISAAPLVKEFLKKLSYMQIEQSKQLAQMRLNELHITVSY